jgi:hypothetical protein
MAEGFTSATGATGSGVHDNREVEPEPTADAPRGWTWNRQTRNWKPKVRGKILFEGHEDAAPDAVYEGVAGDPGDYADDGYEPDPEPSWTQDPAPAAEQFRPSASDRKDIKALIALIYTVPAETLPLADPYCFGPLAERETATGVIDAVADIVSASPKVAKWAVSASGLMPWVKLAIALKPIAVNVLHHHITHSVEVEVDRENRTMDITQRDFSIYSAA